ncbi:MAG: alpha/beta family hydrolase [Planctomycetota bacterium]
MSELHLLWNGPHDAAFTVLLAAGAGTDCRAPFLEFVAEGLAARGHRVARFDFPYMQNMHVAGATKRPPDPMPVLLDAMRHHAQRTGVPSQRLVLAGKSMGGRVATMLGDELRVAGVVVFGYPFHPPRRRDVLRTEHLRTLMTRTLILQGERDPFGTRIEVRDYDLSTAIEVAWFEDGDHSLVPRKRSGHTEEGHLQRAIATAAAFVHTLHGGTESRGVVP